MTDMIDDIIHWHTRAVETRELAKTLTGVAQEGMLQVAEEYEAISRAAAARIVKRQAELLATKVARPLIDPITKDIVADIAAPVAEKVADKLIDPFLEQLDGAKAEMLANPLAQEVAALLAAPLAQRLAETMSLSLSEQLATRLLDRIKTALAYEKYGDRRREHEIHETFSERKKKAE